MIKKIKVLIVDDSIIYRSVLKEALDHHDFIEVVGVASNGKIALAKLKVTPVDLVILDLEMPELDGLSTLKIMNELKIKTKVILFSSLTHEGAEITLEGLRLGASDFVTKPDAQAELGSPIAKVRDLFLPRIEGVFNLQEFSPSIPSPKAKTFKAVSHPLWELYRPKIITIGCSTGGPSVLEKIFSDLGGPLRCPIVIVQHMPPVFTATLAARIAKLSGVPAAEAKDGEELKNQIYFAPGNYHLRLSGDTRKTFMELKQDEPINFVRPAVDPLFETAAKIFKVGCLGIVLTGMGQDGRVGSTFIKENEGMVIIQDEKSCVVFGMPRSVQNEGSFDFIKTPTEISEILKSKAIANS